MVNTGSSCERNWRACTSNTKLVPFSTLIENLSTSPAFSILPFTVIGMPILFSCAKESFGSVSFVSLNSPIANGYGFVSKPFGVLTLSSWIPSEAFGEISSCMALTEPKFAPATLTLFAAPRFPPRGKTLCR